MKVVYIAHPLGGGADRDANIANAARWVVWAADRGVAPVADWLIIAGGWDESKRARGLQIDEALINRCDEVWLCGVRVSAAMAHEAAYARLRNIPVHNLTEEVGGAPFPERGPSGEVAV
jgi:hypothetical protein